MVIKRTYYVVDDDPLVGEVVAALLGGAGHEVTVNQSSVAALPEIVTQQPDCVIIDIMMPEMDGIELCRRMREQDHLANTKIIILSAKAYEFDQRRAFEFGADGYIVKPVDPDTFVDEVERLSSEEVTLTYWGVRGTLPVPGKKSLRYGGNTSCATLELPKGRFFIFDAGSGIKELSNHILATRKGRLDAQIFISHPHWDHINALPFFVPLYIKGNDFELMGPAHQDNSMRDLISAQMDGVYFPITIREFASHMHFRDLAEETIQFGDIEVKTMLLAHPGQCLGYRGNYKGRSFCYITDNELYPPSSASHNERYVEQLADFVRACDILVTDSTYTDDEYKSKIDWGHSPLSQVVDLAHRAEVKHLHLFHHDPDQNDDAIDAKLATAQDSLKELGSATQCLAPAEGDSFEI